MTDESIDWYKLALEAYDEIDRLQKRVASLEDDKDVDQRELAALKERTLELSLEVRRLSGEPAERRPCPVCEADWALMMWHDQYCTYTPPDGEDGHFGGGLPLRTK